MKIILSLVFLIAAYVAAAQQPRYVPFQHQGEISIMDVSGSTFVGPGTFGDYYVVDDFKAYIVLDQLLTDQDFFFNAVSGKGEGDISGRLDRKSGALAIGDRTFYHFWTKGTSAMICHGTDVLYLSQHYLNIEPNRQSWDNENLPGRHFVWALKDDYTYDVLLADQHFKAVGNLPDFTSYDLVFGTSETEELKLKGFVLGSKEAINRSFAQMYGIPQSDSVVSVYDTDFKKLGTAPYREKDISTLFTQQIQLRGSMVPPPQVIHQVIYPEGRTVVLNDEYSLIPSPKDSKRLVLVNTKKNNEPVLGAGDFDYRYFSTKADTKALLQVRHGESNSIFFFDFNGTYFPKGIPMIPKDKME